MLATILAYLGGVLTIASPCILPVLPFVFARSDRPFLRSGLPLLLGMAATFTLFATLAAVSGSWVVTANQYGRSIALVFMALFAVSLLFPRVAEYLMRPLVAMGNRLSNRFANNQQTSVGASLLLGVATGLLWTPCAGPILGLVMTGAMLQGANVGTTWLLLAYAAGAATSLALALVVGGKVFATMKRSLSSSVWLRRGLGGSMLAGVVAISLGWDTGILARISTASTESIEQQLLQKLSAPGETPTMNTIETVSETEATSTAADNQTRAALMVSPLFKTVADIKPTLTDSGVMPPLTGATQWLNSPPLTAEALRGKVVLVHFWTYSCINCQRSLPYVNAWERKYRDQGLVVIGVHSPEFAFERDIKSVAQQAAKQGIDHPIVIDNEFKIWRAYNNQYWPAHYFIDAQGHIRYMHIGEGEYDKSERVIQELLQQAKTSRNNTVS